MSSSPKYSREIPALQGKTIVITGANAGIGKVTARELARGGAGVVLACRNEGAAGAAAAEIRRATGNDNVTTVHLDLASFASVRACAAELAARHDRIDVLVNNAGTYTQGDTLTEDGIHPTMQTNYFGPFLLTNLLLPTMTASGAGRIVNVTSAMYRIGRLDLARPGFLTRKNGFSAYAASKLAMLLFTLELAERLAGTRITANALHPGLVDTKIMSLGKWYDSIIRLYMRSKSKDVEEGAATSVYLASSKDLNGISGGYFVDCAEKVPILGRKYLDMRKTLWEKTSAVVGL